MSRRINVTGGGAKTNLNGLHFERISELKDIFISSSEFEVRGDDIFRKGKNKKVATLFQKHSLYKKLLKPNRIDYSKYISKKLLPDDAILVYGNGEAKPTLYIIEKKFQNGSGSVDEKLQTCDFKKKQYTKLLSPLNIRVEYCYFLCDWFLREEYRDVKEYINSVHYHYFFDSIPLSFLNIK